MAELLPSQLTTDWGALGCAMSGSQGKNLIYETCLVCFMVKARMNPLPLWFIGTLALVCLTAFENFEAFVLVESTGKHVLYEAT